jgi:hypothetical protein
MWGVGCLLCGDNWKGLDVGVILAYSRHLVSRHIAWGEARVLQQTGVLNEFPGMGGDGQLPI